MLDVVSNTRGVVLGASLGTALGGALLVNIFPGLAMVTPFAFSNLIPPIAQGIKPAGFPVWLPIISTLIMSIVFVAVSLWQFNKKAL